MDSSEESSLDSSNRAEHAEGLGEQAGASDSTLSEIELLRQCINNQNEVMKAMTLAMKGMVPAIPEADVRKGKFEKLYMLWLKTNKLKEFKQADHIEVSDWLSQFHTTVNNLASAACDLDLENEPLEPKEFTKLLRYKLSLSADKEVSQAL